MNVCLDCFMKTPKRNDFEFYDRVDIKYVRLTKEPLICELCSKEKPVIEQGVYWLLNPFGETPPPGYIDVQKLAERAENTPYSEGNDAGSINPQEGR